MTGKDVWRWLLPKCDNDTIFHIYKTQKIVCSGFRTNTIKDIKTNRNLLISNLFNKNNYPKLLLWLRKMPSSALEGVSLVDKEVNELVNIAIEKGVAAVFTKLFYEDQEKKAIQLYAFLQDEKSELLNIPNESVAGVELEVTQFDEKKSQPKQESKPESVMSKKNEQKLQSLEQKVGKLTKELEKRDENHKQKLNEMKENLQQTVNKLNEKNRLYSELLKEKNNIADEYREEKDKWNKERNEYEEKIAFLQTELNKLQVKQLQETTKGGLDNNVNSENTNELNQSKTLRILVIGTPAYTSYFQSEIIEFEFVEGNDVHDYQFSIEYDAYWILLYELANKDQFLLNTNTSYSQLDESKITICKDFIDVKKLLEHYHGIRERIM